MRDIYFVILTILTLSLFGNFDIISGRGRWALYSHVATYAIFSYSVQGQNAAPYYDATSLEEFFKKIHEINITIKRQNDTITKQADGLHELNKTVCVCNL